MSDDRERSDDGTTSAGDDTLYVGASARVVDCGPGNDRVVLSGYADETIRVGGSPTEFTDCEQRTTGADLGRAPTLLGALGRWNSLGVPLDTGTTFRSGTRWGPQAMRAVTA